MIAPSVTAPMGQTSPQSRSMFIWSPKRIQAPASTSTMPTIAVPGAAATSPRVRARRLRHLLRPCRPGLLLRLCRPGLLLRLCRPGLLLRPRVGRHLAVVRILGRGVGVLGRGAEVGIARGRRVGIAGRLSVVRILRWLWRRTAGILAHEQASGRSRERDETVLVIDSETRSAALA